MKILIASSLLFVAPAFAQISNNNGANAQVNQQILNQLTIQTQTKIGDVLSQVSQTTTKSANSRIDEVLLAMSNQIKKVGAVPSAGSKSQASTVDFAKLTEVVKTLQTLMQNQSSSAAKDPVLSSLIAAQAMSVVNSSLSMVSQLAPAQRSQYSTMMMGIVDTATKLSAHADANTKNQLTTSASVLKAALTTVQAQTPAIIMLTSMYTTLKSVPNANAATVQNLATQTAAITNAENAQLRVLQSFNENTLLILSNGLSQQLTNSVQSGLGNINVVNDIINSANQSRTAVGNSNYMPQ